MTELRPLTGYVAAPDVAGEVVAPPYDALTPDQRAAHVRANPRSFLSVLPEAEYTHDPELGRARARLDDLIAAGAFQPHPRPFVAVYRLAEGSHAQTGLVADVAVDELRAGRIHAHEHTRPDRVAQIVRFLDRVGVASSPVSLAFGGGDRLRGAIAAAARGAPQVEVLDRGVLQQLWLVDDPDPLLAAAADLTDLYITDGHHRSAAALAYADGAGGGSADAQALLGVLFPADELRLVDYHRVVEHPARPAAEVAAELAGAGWEVAPLDAPREPDPGEVLLVGGGASHLLRMPPRPAGSDPGPVGPLDVARLHAEVLGPVLGIDDPRADHGLRFVPGDRGVDRLGALVRGSGALAFALHPPSMDDLVAVADAGEVMPPKSTYFTPKVRSGLLLRFRA